MTTLERNAQIPIEVTEPLVLGETSFRRRERRIYDPEGELQYTSLQRFWESIKYPPLIGNPLNDVKKYFVRHLINF